MTLERAWSAVNEVTTIDPGTTVLDVGCGTGGFCALAAAHGALVHGIDGSSDGIESARRRVADGDFRVGLMELLPWPDHSFDVVTGFNSFQYALDVDVALREALRVTRPRGRLVVCKWGRPQDNEFFVFLSTLGISAVHPAELRGRDRVDVAFEHLGLTPEVDADVGAVMDMPDDDALATALSSAGAQAPSERPDAWRERVVEAAATWRRPDGGYRFSNRLRYRVVRA
jgi:SAM-dependent methyltransferase